MTIIVKLNEARVLEFLLVVEILVEVVVTNFPIFNVKYVSSLETAQCFAFHIFNFLSAS